MSYLHARDLRSAAEMAHGFLPELANRPLGALLMVRV